MILILSLVIFVLFGWSLLVTVFCFQLHKENEDFARRLGRTIETQRVIRPNYFKQILNYLVGVVNSNTPKTNIAWTQMVRILQLIPLKLNLK